MMRNLCCAACVVLFAAGAHATDPNGVHYSDPLHPWFESLKDAQGRSCCAEADGIELANDDTNNDAGKWKIVSPLTHQWTAVPSGALLTQPNRYHKPVVWIVGNQIRCFIPGAGV